MSLIDRIRASLPALPPAEQRVAKLVLADPRAFASLPVVELAERSHVSKPTVVRFCRSVGYDGLADFKLKLAGTVNEGVPFVHRAVDEDDKPHDIVVKVIDNAVSALLRYRNEAADHAFDLAIEALAQACRHKGRIEFYGVGNSGIVAQDAQHKFFRLGVTATAISDGHVQVMSATMLSPGDCAVIISNSGRSRDLLTPKTSPTAKAPPPSSSPPVLHPWPTWPTGTTGCCWPPTTPRTTTATAPWFRGCCT